ncbi:MAG: aldehyde ferredoxin oxidoreductase family protein [Candidatus Thorarchaeota archaeon]|jgi:aldehyde:ferredoxin oxidoreductase
MVMLGWNGKILWIDLTNKESREENVDLSIYEKFIGGKGLGAYLLYRELEAAVDPLSPENVILFMTGPLQGLPAPNVGRWTLVTKSPLTGIYLDTHCGGALGREIKTSGYDVVGIRGKADKPTTVVIEDESISFENASDIWGKGVHESTMVLKDRNQKGAIVYVIGPAGERMSLIATGCCELAHQTGRGGAGAVMGSKNLKAVVAKGSKRIALADKDVFGAVRREAQELWDDKGPDYGFKKYGTASLIETANIRGQFPTRNWQSGYFEEHENLWPEKLTEWYAGNDMSCPHCIMRCTHAYRTDVNGKEVLSTPEYETWGMMAGDLGISDPLILFKLNYLADDLGLDTIGAGSVIAFAMEAFEKGMLTEDEIGFPLRFGDGQAAIHALRMIAMREGIGDVLALGTRKAAAQIGKGSEELAIHVKGLETAAWDPRGKKGLGLSYATADVGSHHLRGWPDTNDPPTESAIDMVESMIEQRYLKTLRDSLVVCHFTWRFPLGFDPLIRLLNAATGLKYDQESINLYGQRVETLTRMFNQREGIARADDILPKRFWEGQVSGPNKGLPSYISKEDFEASLDMYYDLMGWDKEDGLPTADTLKKLSLDDIV